MTQIGEAIALPVPHSDEHPDCPFCPGEEPKDFTTIEGDENHSGTLGKNMDDPDNFARSRESGARPKDPPSARKKEWLKKPKPIGTHPDATVGDYSCEPHHLISGKQALAKNGEHKFEQWIKASHGTIAADTGYSVNNYDNGIWMPSVPEITKGNAGAWGKMDRQAIANHIMAETRRQFHKGAHNIRETRVNEKGEREPVADDKAIHRRYDKFLILHLAEMNRRMHGWANVCPFCFEGDVKKEKVQPSYRVNDALDRLAGFAKAQITGPRTSWEIFISSLAFIYHDEVCTHGRVDDESSVADESIEDM